MGQGELCQEVVYCIPFFCVIFFLFRDEEEDGEWEAPQIRKYTIFAARLSIYSLFSSPPPANPACENVGCGEWKPPIVQNPEYKGKWKPPLIDNPDFIVRAFTSSVALPPKDSLNHLGILCVVNNKSPCKHYH